MKRGKTWVIHKNTNRGTKSIENSSTLYHLYIPTVILKPLTIIQHVAPGMAYRGHWCYMVYTACFNKQSFSKFVSIIMWFHTSVVLHNVSVKIDLTHLSSIVIGDAQSRLSLVPTYLFYHNREKLQELFPPPPTLASCPTSFFLLIIQYVQSNLFALLIKVTPHDSTI